MSFLAVTDWPTFAPDSTRGAALVRSPFISFFMPHFSVAFSGLLLSLALASTAQAQTATPADTARTYKHHLGLTASPVLSQFFTANRSLPVGLLYKRESKPGRLLRLGVQFTQNSNNRLDGINYPAPAYVSNNFAFNVVANAGREYSRPLSRRWTGTTGADVVVGYGYARAHTEGGTNSVANGELARRERTDTNHFYLLAVAPFVGIRYSPHKRLYATAEATVSVAYRRVQAKIEGATIGLVTGNQTDEIGGRTRYNLINIAFRPVSQLTLHYLI